MMKCRLRDETQSFISIGVCLVYLLCVSERLKGGSAGRFKRGQFDRKGTFDLDGRFHLEPGIEVGAWHAS